MSNNNVMAFKPKSGKGNFQNAAQIERAWSFSNDEEQFIYGMAARYGADTKKFALDRMEIIELFMTRKNKVLNQPDFIFVKEPRHAGTMGYQLRIGGSTNATIDSIAFSGISTVFKGYIRFESERVSEPRLRLV